MLPRSLFESIVLLFALVCLTGCAGNVVQQRERYFWPPPPGEPKVEFIRVIAADYDVTIGYESLLKEAVFGRETPKPFMSRPISIAARRGRVFVGDTAAKKVFVLDFIRKEIRSLRDEMGVDISFAAPFKIVVDDTEQTWVMDTYTQTLHCFSPQERRIRELRLQGLERPVGFVVTSQGDIYVVDAQASKVVVFDKSGERRNEFGQPGKNPGQFNTPSDIVCDGEGNFYVLDGLNARIQVFDATGKFLRTFGERGTTPGRFSIPKYLAISPAGHLYVTDAALHKVVIFDRKGDFLLSLGGKAFSRNGKISPGGMALPSGIAVDEKNSIWLVDGLNGILQNYQYLDADYLRTHPPIEKDVRENKHEDTSNN